MAANLRNCFPIFILCSLFLCFASCCTHSNISCGNFSTTIKPPFYTIKSSPTCKGSHMIKCNDKNVTLIQFNNQGNSYILKNISYTDNTILVQDQNIRDPLWGSNCSFLFHSLTNFPVDNLSLHSSILNPEGQYFNCDSIKMNFSNEFDLNYRRLKPCKDYNLYFVQNQKANFEVLPKSCLPQQTPMFEWNLSYNSTKGDLLLLSAGFSRRLELQLGCFNCQVIGDSCSVNGASWASACRGILQIPLVS